MKLVLVLSIYLSFPCTYAQIFCSVPPCMLFCDVWGVVFFRRPLLHRTVVGPAFKGPSLILSLCSWFNMDRPGQSRRKPPLPPLCFLCSALYLTSLSLPSPQHIQSRTRRWITIIVLEHSTTLQKRQEKKECCYTKSLLRQVVAAVPFQTRCAICFIHGAVFGTVFPHRENKSLS